ncbi:MAG: competence/damage-inducible protein A [Candidatus Thorarchaeota archaeon]|nr:competence/damage-inducible protein A [Candidatus Thorarchaeota archaeon]
MSQERNRSSSLVAGILTIGDEVLTGLVQDTNANWIELKLSAMGVTVKRTVSVRDELKEIKAGLDFLAKTCDVILTSGGLGPTHDDKTLEGIAHAFNRKLEQNPKALEIVRRQYRNLFEKGIVDTPEMTPAREKMAKIPKGGTPLDNRVGGAPGVMISEGDLTIFCLPGVPDELKFIFEDSVQPWIEEHTSSAYYEETIEFPTKDETIFAPYIDEVMEEHDDVYIKSMPKTYGTTNVLRVWVSAKGAEEEELKEKVQAAIESLSEATELEYRTAKDVDSR